MLDWHTQWHHRNPSYRSTRSSATRVPMQSSSPMRKMVVHLCRASAPGLWFLLEMYHMLWRTWRLRKTETKCWKLEIHLVKSQHTALAQTLEQRTMSMPSKSWVAKGFDKRTLPFQLCLKDFMLKQHHLVVYPQLHSVYCIFYVFVSCWAGIPLSRVGYFLAKPGGM